MSPTQISDYTLLPLSIPPTPAFPKQTNHTLYLRPHEPKIPSPDDARSLFLVNLPIDATVAHLRALFASLIGAGKFESATFEHERKSAANEGVLVEKGNANKKRKRGQDEESEGGVDLPRVWDRELRRSGSTAVVVLVDEKCVEVALKSILKLHRKAAKGNGKGEGVWPIWGEGVEEVMGSARYSTHNRLRFPDKRELQRNVDAFMTLFNTTETTKIASNKRLRNEPDEDGFVTVTRGGRVGPARQEEVERKRVEMEEKEKKKRGEMGDFYRFQMRERRKEEQGEMVRRFEEDRRRVEGMRASKKSFRPET